MDEMKERRFGDVIHDARLRIRPQLSLRQFAAKLGIAAAYLSKIENNLDKAPAADKVERMAEILGLDKIDLLRLAKRLPTEFAEAFNQDQRAPDFMRVAMGSGLSPDELERRIRELKAKKTK